MHQKKDIYTADEIDQTIIDALKEDGRRSNASIAEILGVTEGAIRQRVKNLLARKVLKITGQVDPEILVGHQLALISINLKESHTLQSKAEEVAALSEVLNVSIAAGRYDLLAEILVDSNDGLISFLADSLPTVSGIENTESFLILKSINKWI